MLTTINKYTQIKGVTIYRCTSAEAGALPNNWIVSPAPAAIDVDITLPEQSHPTTDIQMMGSISIPDQTRIDNMQLTVNINTDSLEASALSGAGIVYWKICWVDEVVDPSGNLSLLGWTVYASGYIGAQPESAKNAGSENTGDLSMNVVSIKKQNSNGYVAYDINRLTNRLERGGINYRAALNALL